MHRLYSWVTLILLIPFAHAADQAVGTKETGQVETLSVLTLQDALKLALQANPEVAIALREREATEGMRVQAGVRPNPTLSAFVEAAHGSAQKTTVQISQPLELGNKRSARLAAADARLNAAATAIEAKQAEIHANVI